LPVLYSRERLKEGGWQAGDAAKSWLRGNDRRLVNQHVLGVLTKSTLMKIQEGGGPELMPEPLIHTRNLSL
jgi:hypothetical protein